MKIYLPDFFPERMDDDKRQEEFTNKGGTFDPPPDDFHKKLAASTKARNRLLEIENGKSKPSSLEVLVTLLSELVGASPFSFANKIGVAHATWKEVLLHKRSPDDLPPKSICELSKLFSIPFVAWKEALIGSFVLCKTGSSQISLARSSNPEENIGAKRIDAVQELLIKAAGKGASKLTPKMEKFLSEVEACMNLK